MAISARSGSGGKILVAGLGASGKAVEEFLKGRGEECETYDEKADADFSDPKSVNWGEVRAAVVSPGFAPSSPLVRAAEENRVPVVSEVEFAWKTRPGTGEGRPIPWVGVTGTNGKTTTVKMLTKIFEECGLCVAEGGNTGYPLTLACRKEGAQIAVVELSSAQLQFTRSLSLDVAVWTNFAGDHLDWHGSLEAYRLAKAKIFENAKRAAIYNAQDPVTAAAAQSAETRPGCALAGFRPNRPDPGQIGVDEGWIFDKAFGRGRICRLDSMDGLKVGGSVPRHRVENALAAAAAALAMGAKPEQVARGLREFRPEGHRLEPAARVEKDGGPVDFIDDSKATNPASALAALASLEGRGIEWIVGGQTKGCDMLPMLEEARGKVRRAVLIGKDRSQFAKALSEARIPFCEVKEEDGARAMEEAVRLAFASALPGDAVLLAPACASRDQFGGMSERGEMFKRFAKALKGGEAA